MDINDPPYERPQNAFARVFGLNRYVFCSVATIAVLTTATAIVAGGLAWRERLLSEGRVERYVVYLDEQSLPVSTTHVSVDWEPKDGTYIDFAQRWVRYLRARPTDEGALKYQRGEVIRTTAQRLYGQLQDSMRQTDTQLRTAAVDVTSITSNLVEKPDPNTARVLVRWTEQVRSGGTKEVPWSVLLTIVYVPPKVQREFERNPLGLFVTDFQPTQESH